MGRQTAQTGVLGHRGGFFYVLDRETGKPFWLSRSRPRPGPKAWMTKAVRFCCRVRSRLPKEPTSGPECKALLTGTRPVTTRLRKLFYLAVWENRSVYRKGEQEYTPGNRYIGSVPLIDLPDDPGTGLSGRSIQNRRAGLGVQAAYQALGRRAINRRQAGLWRQRRRLLLRARCRNREGAVASEYGRHHSRQSDHLPEQGEASNRDRGG